MSMSAWVAYRHVGSRPIADLRRARGLLRRSAVLVDWSCMSEGHKKSGSFGRGSQRRRWDLHIHSPLTILNSQYPKLPDGAPDWDAYLAKLSSLDAGVIAITDYFTIEGYKRVKKCKDEGGLPNITTVLPNIEFRLNSVLASKKDGQQPRRLNFHVIFSDEVSVQDIEEHFLHDLDFFYEGNPQGDDDKRKLKISNLEALGKKLKAQHAPFKNSGLSDLIVGATQAVVGHEEISKRLQDPRFRGKYLVVFPEEQSNLIDWDGQDHHTRKALLQKADMAFSSSPKTGHWCLGRDPYSEGVDQFLEEFKSLKPCIHGSDAHKLEEIGHPCALRGQSGHICAPVGAGCALRFCWVKADPTFEGFKQLLYEPGDRVRIQDNDPSPPRSNFTLDSVHISAASINNDLSVRAADVSLNPGLVAVAGGKGSGKTAFLDLIANCYTDRCNTKDKNSFVRRIVDHDPVLSTSLTFRDGTTFAKKLKDGHYFENSELVYIAQGELETYIDEKSDLENYVRSLIFDAPNVRDTVLIFEFGELVKQLEECSKELSGKNTAIGVLEARTSPVVVNSLAQDRKKKEAELKDCEARIAEYEKGQSAERVEVAKKKQALLGELKANKEDLIALRGAIAEAVAFLEEHVAGFNRSIAEINNRLAKVNIATKVNDLTYPDKASLVACQGQVTGLLSTVVAQVEAAQKELANLEQGVQEHAGLLEKKRELLRALEAIAARGESVKKSQEDLKQTIEERKASLKRQYDTVLVQKKKYEDIIAAFSAQKADVLSDLKFGAKVQFDAEALIAFAEEIIDNRKVQVRPTTEYLGELAALVGLVTALVQGEAGASLEAIVNEIERLNDTLRGKLKVAKTISLQDLATT